MKELTIEEKARRYDEALKAVKSLQEVNPSDEGIQNWVNENFPEFKESEDESIRKVLIELVKCNEKSGYKLLNNVPTSSMVAWLEKQGEQKQTVIIPRFRVGDVITSTKNSALKYKIKAVGVLNELGEYDYVVEDVTDTDYKGRIHKMSISKVDEWGVVVEQKLAWSEEDKNRFTNLISLVKCSKENNATKAGFIEFINKLKSLSLQNTWKPSDEQMKALSLAMCGVGDPLFSLYQDLEKLKG